MEASSSTVDLEVRSLGPADNGFELRLMMEFFAHSLDAHTNFELVQTLLNVFLRAHGDVLVEMPELMKLAQQLLVKQRRAWDRLAAMCQHNLCLVHHVSGIQA